MEQANFVFGTHPTRFAYRHKTHNIRLPCKQLHNELDKPSNPRYTTIFHWVICSLNHEYLHKLLHEFVGFDAMHNLDRFSYGDIVCGFIDVEQI